MSDQVRVPIQTDNAPQPIGPYSQAIKCGGMVYASGQIALDKTTGQLINADAAGQTRLVLQHLQEILEMGGSSLARVVKVTIYLIDMIDFPDVNKVYSEFFPFEPPARVTVQVSALPKGARVEIDAIGQCTAGAGGLM